MVHSDSTVVDFEHNTFGYDLALSVILLALSCVVRTLLQVNLILCHMSTIHSPFSCQLFMSNSSSVLIVFC